MFQVKLEAKKGKEEEGNKVEEVHYAQKGFFSFNKDRVFVFCKSWYENILHDIIYQHRFPQKKLSQLRKGILKNLEHSCCKLCSKKGC